MGDRSGISVFGSGARQHSGRVALLAGLLVVALDPWSSGPAHRAGAAGSTAAGASATLFGCAASYAVGSEPYSVAVGDVNGDGNLDLVTANAGSTVSVLLNSGPCFTPSPTRGYPSTVVTLSGYNYGHGERVNVY